MFHRWWKGFLLAQFRLFVTYWEHFLTMQIEMKMVLVLEAHYKALEMAPKRWDP